VVHINLLVLALISIMLDDFLLSSQALHPCTFMFFVLHDWTKIRFEHDLSRQCIVHLFLLPSLMVEEGGGSALHRHK
jgi:hypothetical protein